MSDHQSHMTIELPDGTSIKRKVKFLLRNGESEIHRCISAAHVSQILRQKFADTTHALSESDVYNWCSSLERRPKKKLTQRLSDAGFEIIKL